MATGGQPQTAPSLGQPAPQQNIQNDLLRQIANVLQPTANPQDPNQTAQVAALLTPHVPHLLKLAKGNMLNPNQLSQLQNLVRIYGPAIQQHQAQQRALAARQNGAHPQNSGPSGAPQPANPSPAAAPLPPASAPAPPPNGAQAPPAPAPVSTINPSAATANSNPPPAKPQIPLAFQPLAMPNAAPASITNSMKQKEPPAATEERISGNPFPASSVTNIVNPGPQPWPNTQGVRPSLSGGLAAGSTMLGTPTYLSRVADGQDALEYIPNGPKKDTPTEAGGKRTAKDLIASINPNVAIQPEVEDLLLELSDEFVDSVTHFACRLAKHRGSETLDVRDVQLHLERNHNIRIPGFSSDEARLSTSQSHIGGPSHGAKLPKGEKNLSLRAARLHAIRQAK